LQVHFIRFIGKNGGLLGERLDTVASIEEAGCPDSIEQRTQVLIEYSYPQGIS
jgi:hypothetical protein